MYVHVHVYVCVYIHVHVCVYVHVTAMCVCVCVSVHVHDCVCVYVHVHVCVYVHVHICVYVHVTSMCVCMYMYTSVCIPLSYVHLWIVLSSPYTSSYTHCRLDVASKATTLVHSIFGGYLRSRGMYVPVIQFEYLYDNKKR